LLDKNKKQTQG